MAVYEHCPINPEEFQEICRQMDEAEKSGELDGLFKGLCGSSKAVPGKEAFVDSFNPEMRLFRSTFIKIYGYELTWPGFAENALDRLEELGCSRAREYYFGIVAEYEQRHEEEMRKVAEWYKKQGFNRREGEGARSGTSGKRKWEVHMFGGLPQDW